MEIKANKTFDIYNTHPERCGFAYWFLNPGISQYRGGKMQ